MSGFKITYNVLTVSFPYIYKNKIGDLYSRLMD